VGRVAHHERAPRLDPRDVEEHEQHVRMGFGEAFIGAPGGLEPAGEPRRFERAIEAPARLAGRDREAAAATVQLAQHLAHALVERRLVLAREEVVAIALGEP
jgi:hypothetical protein